MRGVLALVMLLTTQAYAMPPEPGSDDELAIRGYEQWITQMQTKDGGLCCSIADGRVVADSELRVRDEQLGGVVFAPSLGRCGD